MGYDRSSNRVFESYLTIVVSWDEKGMHSIRKQNNSYFNTYEILPVIYSIKVISETIYTLENHDRTLQVEVDDTTVNQQNSF